MRRIRRFFRPLAIGYIILVGGLGYAVVGLEHDTERLTQLQINSTDSRIVTIEQRCTLTHLVLENALRGHAPNAPRLQQSLSDCKVQLTAVKKAAASK